MFYSELTEVTDLFENDELVLMQAEGDGIAELSLGLKDSSGDIYRIIKICDKG